MFVNFDYLPHAVQQLQHLELIAQDTGRSYVLYTGDELPFGNFRCSRVAYRGGPSVPQISFDGERAASFKYQL